MLNAVRVFFPRRCRWPRYRSHAQCYDAQTLGPRVRIPFGASVIIPVFLYKTEGSLPCSQRPATCPYPEPDESNPQPHILFLLRSNLMLFSCLRLVILDGILFAGSPTKDLYPR